jgi:hypothetical protein
MPTKERIPELRQKRKEHLIEVCDKCLRASCWHGVFMCDEAYSAGTVSFTRRELRKLNREHSDYFSPKEIERVCGEAYPPAPNCPRGKLPSDL